MKNRTLVIAGAGLVGSLLAILLRQRGFQVVVFEKRNDPRLAKLSEGRSINLVITSRGINALKIANAYDETLKLTVPVFGRTIHNRQGETYYQPYGIDNECNLSVSRLQLNQFLINKAESLGVKIHFSKSINSVDFNTKKIFFDDGNSQSYELLFATDGAGSAIRKSLIKTHPSIYLEKVEPIHVDYVELFMPALSEKKYALNEKSLHIWPRGPHMLMALANIDGSFTATLYLPHSGTDSFERLSSENKLVEDFFNTEYSSAYSHMPSCVEDFLSRKPSGLGTIKLSKWNFSDSVMLLGDAAHAIVPFFGQGMNCGFEDCAELLRLMDLENSWTGVFEQLNKTRIENANAIADMAVENWFEMSTHVGNTDFLLKKKIESIIEKKQPEFYVSRYRMIAYSLTPYAKAQEIGLKQNECLSKVLDKIKSRYPSVSLNSNIEELLTEDDINLCRSYLTR